MQPKSKHEHETLSGLTTRAQLLNALESEAHVWFAFAHKHSDPKLLAWYRDLLSEEELEKYKSFYFARDRDLYLLTHGFVRATLSRYLKIAPQKWVFIHNRYGCPEIAQSEEKPQLRFSVSRTHGLVACLLVLSIDAGVDVERIRKLDNLNTLFEHVLTPPRISKLRDLPESDHIEAFFTFWTLKEAYIKARGEGLSLSLKDFTFYLDAEGCIRISTDAQLKDIPSSWQFESFRPTRSHAVALALRRKDRPDFRIRFFEAIPRLNRPTVLYQKQYAFQNHNNLKSKKTSGIMYNEMLKATTLTHLCS